MHAVVRRRVEDPFERAEPHGERRVQKELIDQSRREHRADGEGRKADPGQRQKEDEGAGQLPGPEADRSRQIEMRRRVMHRVRRPQPAHAVRGAVEPVVGELGAEEERAPAPRRVERNVDNRCR